MSERRAPGTALAQAQLTEETQQLRAQRTLYLEARRFNVVVKAIWYLTAVLLILAAGMLVAYEGWLVQAVFTHLPFPGESPQYITVLVWALRISVYALALYLFLQALRVSLVLRTNGAITRAAAAAGRKIDRLNRQSLSLPELAQQIERDMAAGRPVTLYPHQRPDRDDVILGNFSQDHIREQRTDVDMIKNVLFIPLLFCLTVAAAMVSPALIRLGAEPDASLRPHLDQMLSIGKYAVPGLLGAFSLMRLRTWLRTSRQDSVGRVIGHVISLALMLVLIFTLLLLAASIV